MNWDRPWDNNIIPKLNGHEDDITSRAYYGGGSRIVTASRDSTAPIWHAANGKELLVPRGHEHVLSAAFSPDGLRIVTASEDKTERI